MELPTKTKDFGEAVDDAFEYLLTVLFGIMTAANIAKASDSPREAFRDARPQVEAGLRGKRRVAGQSAGGIITTVLAIGITAVIGTVLTVVVDQTQQASGLDDPANNTLAAAEQDVIGGYGDAMSLLGVVFLVLLLGVVVAALFGLVPGQGN